jgi:LSD1 subclass zinc finger protein
MEKCPGDGKYFRCFSCGELIEILSNNETIKCPLCDKLTMINGIPKCWDWCRDAKKCKKEQHEIRN